MKPLAPLLVPGFLALLAAHPGHAQNNPAGAPDEWAQPGHGAVLASYLVADQLEFRLNDGHDLARWDVEGWVGGDVDRLWLKTEGEVRTSGHREGDAELQLLYGRAFAPFWDLQIGVRQDVLFGPGPDRERSFAALGVEGLAPYWFEVTPTLFLSDDGDVSARFTGTHELHLTQRLIAQSRLELEVAAHDVREFGIARGLNDIELGLRVRYEIRREIAPYIGVSWLRKLGNTADLAREDGESTHVVGLVAGLRVWF